MQKEIIFREGMKPLWQRLLAAALYTILFYFILLFFINRPIAFTKSYIRGFDSLMHMVIVIIATALPLSLTRNHYFDFNNKKYKLEYTIGYLKYGTWKPLPNLEYLSVFQKQDGIFEVNLWYKGNNHFNVYTFFDIEDSISMGYIIADKLEIDLLDATSHHDFKWINKKVYKESGKVEYLN